MINKKIKPLLVFGLFFWGFCFSATSQNAILEVTNMDNICSGFTQDSYARLKITTNTPFRLPDRAGIVFDWYADHANAKKQWNTPLDTRMVPVPWPGEYRIFAVVRYVDKQTLSTFNSFKSPVIRINVEECNVSKSTGIKKGPQRIKSKNE